MMMPCSCKDVVVFDLDDTLYKVIDYLKSGYMAIARKISASTDVKMELYERMMQWYEGGENAFQNLCRIYPKSISIEQCLDIYRTHKPSIKLDEECRETLRNLKNKGCILGIITDGREITQRNKIEALGLDEFIDADNVVISESFGSEKPDERNYRYFMERYPDLRYTYIADNVKKDFIAPNRLGWNTICLLDDGRNIHEQTFDAEEGYLPKSRISEIEDCINYLRTRR